jgi:hypothetical protein
MGRDVQGIQRPKVAGARGTPADIHPTDRTLFAENDGTASESLLIRRMSDTDPRNVG